VADVDEDLHCGWFGPRVSIITRSSFWLPRPVGCVVRRSLPDPLKASSHDYARSASSWPGSWSRSAIRRMAASGTVRQWNRCEWGDRRTPRLGDRRSA